LNGTHEETTRRARLNFLARQHAPAGAPARPPLPPAARQLETEGDAKARALRSAVCMIDIGNYFVFFLYKKAQSIPVDMRRYRFFKDV